MVLFILFLCIFGLIDIIALVEKRDFKGLVVYLVLIILVLVFAIYFFINELGDSLVMTIFKLFNVKV